MKELKETVKLMDSKDYKERFKAEYWQLKIRYEKLKKFNTQIEAAARSECAEVGVLVKPKYSCPASMLREQQSIMGEYLHMLEMRAVFEEIDLEA